MIVGDTVLPMYGMIYIYGSVVLIVQPMNGMIADSVPRNGYMYIYSR